VTRHSLKNLMESEREKLLRLEDDIHKRVVDRTRPVSAVCERHPPGPGRHR